MKVSMVSPTDLSRDEVAAWRAIQADHPEYANPFLGPDFAQALGTFRPKTRVAVAREAGEPVAFLPFEHGSLGIGRALGMGISDCQALVQRPGAVTDAEPLLRACGLTVWEFDHLVAGTPPFASFARAHHASPVIDVSDGYEAYLERVSQKFLRNMRRRARNLEREHGDVRFVFDETDPDMLRTLMRWKSAQYRRTGRRDRFGQPWITETVKRLHTLRNGSPVGLLSVLYAGDRPAAAHFGLWSERVGTMWFPAYDTRFSRYSPGLLLLLRMAEEAAAAGMSYLDLGRGASEYKNTFKTRDLTVAEGWAALPSTGAAAHWLRRVPAGLAYEAVLSRPYLRRTARRTLNGLGTIRTRLPVHARPASEPE